LSGAQPSDPRPETFPSADVIVVAAGRSTRMGGTDKLQATIAGATLLSWTLRAISSARGVERIVLVTNGADAERFRASGTAPAGVSDIVVGGVRRQASVAAGFRALGTMPADQERVLLVHDGARPLVSTTLVEAVILATARHGAAIPVLPVTETLKRVEGDVVAGTVDREGIGAAQTPQGVRRGLLRAAYERFPPDGPETWTDEAALLEACRIAVHVVPGDPSNLKVTLPADLRRTEAALGGGRGARVGFGQDSHPFGPGEPLALGGIVIDGAPRLQGHSDGDVALHAVCDALLGAAGLGDLGRAFPAGPETPMGVASTAMLAEVVRRIGAAGWTVGNLDVTIVGARPRLGARLDAMRAAIAGTIGVDPGRVNMKASTGNLGGDEGAGRSMTAFAVASLEPAS
jgi:2-C-methyl-D-erythritol 4-phosphate cytidylyltransferase / 2-C-methyl-D-erythritol 2,4-cyclodiphosphate synthase